MKKVKKVNKLLLFALMAGAIFASSSFAADVTDWDGFKDAINGTDDTINVNGDITYGGTTNSISRTLSIIGTETGKYLSGNNQFKGLTIDYVGDLTLNNITMKNFVSDLYGGAINNNGKITSITGDFISNSASIHGGAIYNTSTNSRIDSITGDFIENSAQNGGAIYNSTSNTINSITGNFKSNTATSTETTWIANGGAICNYGTIDSIKDSTFTDNTATDNGGAIYNNGEIYIKDSTFTGNAAKNGGAIYNDIAINPINIVADDRNITFSDNYITSSESKGGAIYNKGTLGLYAKEGKNITFVGGADDTTNNKYNIDGIYNGDDEFATLNINGTLDSTNYTGTVNLYTVNGQGTTNIYSGTVGVKGAFEQDTLDVKSGATLDLAKGQINKVDVNTLNFADGAKLKLDVGKVDSVNKIDNITYSTGTGKIAINEINLISDIDTGHLTWLSSMNEEVQDSTLSIAAATKNAVYNFTKFAYGVLNVAKGTAVSLPDIIQTHEEITSYSLIDGDETMGANLGTLVGTGRNFTINGNGHALDGKKSDDEIFAGITVQDGQTLTINNATMKNFKKEGGSDIYGGAINNSGTITSITGNFESNTATSTETSGTLNAQGGAIYNEGSIERIAGNFTSNTVISTGSAQAKGGAIYNTGGTINNITGDFEFNSATQQGGAINNESTIGNITDSNFKNNTANIGGAIYNKSIIDSITGDFEFNSATTSGGAIHNTGGSAEIDNITGNFKGNHADSYGGAIYNTGTIENITGDFENNYTASTTGGGAIFNTKTINISTSNEKPNILFKGNYVTAEGSRGGAIYNMAGTLGLYAVNTGDKIEFTGTTPTEIPTGVTPQDIDGIYNQATLNINGNGTNTYAGTVILQNVSDAATAKGSTNIYGGNVSVAKDITQKAINVANGATLTTNGNVKTASGITNAGTLNLLNGTSETSATIDSAISGVGTTNIERGVINATKNITQNNINVKSGAELNSTGNIKVTENLTNDGIVSVYGIEGKIKNNTGGSLTFNDTTEIVDIDLTNSGTVNFDGQLNVPDFKFILTQNGGVMNFSTTAIESTAEYGKIDTFTMNGGSVNIADNSINTLHVGELNLTDDTKFIVDVDFRAEGQSSDMLDVDPTVSTFSDDKYLLLGFNLMSDMEDDVVGEEFIFATGDLKDHIQLISNQVGKGTNNPYQTEYHTPIYKYDVQYKIAPESEGSTEMVGWLDFSRDAFNPAVMAAPIAAQIGGYLNQLNSYEQAFQNMDMQMLMTKEQRQAMKFRNKLAAAGVGADLVTYDPNQRQEESRGIWFRPYASFEKVNLQGGPKVENIMYGTFLGGDSDLIELKNGWDMMYSAYASYDGSHQNYDGVSIYQNGGHLGGTAVFYKDNFFTGLTANAGASVAEASTMYGTDNMTMLMAGVASKTGYNWELLNSKLIVQPSMLLSYSFVNMFDYKNAAGVNIDSDPLHAIQVAPGLKFIGNLPNGWQPYVGIQMIWNIMDETKFQAANVNLPQLSVRPYFQYGLGVQKKWGDRFTGFVQAMFRNGGRTGVAFSAGLRWAIGQDGTHTTSHKTPELPKTKMNLSSMK